MSTQNDVNHTQDIFEALIAKHEIQRDLCDKLEATEDKDERLTIYNELKLELQAHAAAEERHLYLPVMQHDDGLDLSRHAITEHHEMDELMESLDEEEVDNDNWNEVCADLIHKVRHHLKEEENDFFKQARQLLDKKLQQRLGALYQVEHDEFESNHKSA